MPSPARPIYVSEHPDELVRPAWYAVAWESRVELGGRTVRYVVRYQEEDDHHGWRAVRIEDALEVELGRDGQLTLAQRRCRADAILRAELHVAGDHGRDLALEVVNGVWRDAP